MNTNKITRFRVWLNGKRVCVAGIAGDCVLTAIVTHVGGHERDETFLRVGGLESASDEYPDWSHESLKTGDEIRIQILDSGRIDRPKKRTRRDPKQDLKMQKRNVRKMAREFGWEIKTNKAK